MLVFIAAGGIISSDNEQIVAVSFTSQGERMFTLKKDGSFHFYQTLYALKDYPPHKKGDSFSVVSFGNYKTIQSGN